MRTYANLIPAYGSTRASTTHEVQDSVISSDYDADDEGKGTFKMMGRRRKQTGRKKKGRKKKVRRRSGYNARNAAATGEAG